MNIGSIRKARLGESPTHYAMEDIRANEALISTHMNMIRDTAERQVFPPVANTHEVIFGIATEMALDRYLHDEMNRRKITRAAERRQRRTDRMWMVMVLLLGGFILGMLVLRLGQEFGAYIAS